MEQVESDIRRVLQGLLKITANARNEEAKIDGLHKEIKLCEDRMIIEEDSGELEKQELQNLISYQTTLISRASSRTQLLRALHEDLLVLFLKRKQLRRSDGAGGSSVDVVPNVSLSSVLSSGDDNQEFPSNCNIPDSMATVRMNEEHDNLEEISRDQEQLPLVLQINMNEDACLTPESGSVCGDLRYKSNVLDNIAMSILDPNTNIDSIFKEAMGNSDFPFAATRGTKKMPKKTGHPIYCNLAKRLTVDFDENGNPIGPNAGGFKRSINSFVCHCLPIRFKQIGDVPVEDYKSVLNVLTERYNFDPNRSYTRKKISSCYRQHKYKLLVQVKKDLETGIEPQKPSYVKKEDWDAFVAKTRDEEFDRISKKNKASRSRQSALNRKGLPDNSDCKRKLKESEQVFVDDSIWPKEHKPKRGRPRKLLDVVDDNHDVVENTSLHDNREQGFESDPCVKTCSGHDAASRYDYWNHMEANPLASDATV